MLSSRLGRWTRSLGRISPSALIFPRRLFSSPPPPPPPAPPLPTTANLPPAQDPYRYSAGRWLLRDAQQRQARHVQFDFAQLCAIAVGLSEGASRVASYEKKEGGYNRAFVLALDNGRRVVARIPTRVAGAPRLATNSEVATVRYLQSKISLPVPAILAWSDDPANPVGCEYTIQEHAEGVQLDEHWSQMNTHQHMLCTKALSFKLSELASLDFPAYGSIYFADAPIDVASLKIPLEDGFCIGPYCSPLFWNLGAGEPELYGESSPNRGPWTKLSGYASGLIDTAYSRLPTEQVAAQDRRHFRGSVGEHRRLLKICHETMKLLIEDRRVQDASIPTLLHADYNKRNIFVSPDDPTTITGFIDWQLTCIEPAFIYAQNTPDFAALPDIDPSEEEEDSSPKNRDEEKLLKDLSICHQTYDVIATYKCPKLRPARQLDPSLFRLFHYCFTSWRDGAPALRQELIDLAALWPKLNLPGSECPYSPTEEELAEHARHFEDFESMQKLKMWLKVSMGTTGDGWVPNDVWEAAREANRAAYDEWMETARESEAKGGDMTVARGERLWPFDIV
ncbi:hypothetical protein LOZ54_006603 [Ophidiomyces ophidiicola]|nr:hypothetical protein LOZ54_006603 [Ophidiomyces ophidiicola]